jgi:hypothetical protein
MAQFAVDPSDTDWAVGGVVIIGGACTVKVSASLVTVPK